MSAAHDFHELTCRYGALDGAELLQALLVDGPLAGRTALVSSFGAESVVLLHLAAEIDRKLPVIFLDTGKHFPATLAYRDQLVELLRLEDIRVAAPTAKMLKRLDPQGLLHDEDADSCCHLRKTEPLEEALAGFGAWITGRKRFQGGMRTALEPIELDPSADRIKLNPLARWAAGDLEAYRVRHGLPQHPLAAHGYRSIGCAPCTRATRAGEAARAGRWFGIDKVECGSHLGSAQAGVAVSAEVGGGAS
jgi:phosphoadenosine phosphosulfate reductase